MQNRFFITIFAISLFLTINAFAQREATDSADTKAKCLTICDFEDLISDSDGDGVIDKLDREHDTPKGCRVDTNGIALDSDSDGIKDCVDREPFT
ncbi:MAG: hypothetical protein RI894_2544, partial [Bacteroidota bacterium]